MLNSENRYDLKKLQFTIQQLVTSSPCRSSDGIFYSGKYCVNPSAPKNTSVTRNLLMMVAVIYPAPYAPHFEYLVERNETSYYTYD